MKIRLFPYILVLLFSSLAMAGEDLMTTAAKDSPWRVGGGYSQLFGLKTEFRGLGQFASPNNAQPLGAGLNRDYDDGFVYLDSSGNTGGQTWNWSYDNAVQYNADSGGVLNYSITNSLANAKVGQDGDTHPGVELFAYYDMGAAKFLSKSFSNATWGLRFGLQYSRVDIDNHSTLTTGLTTTTDSFALGGVIAPLAPYTGSFLGPGPLLGDNPTRSVSLEGVGSVRGGRELDLDLTLFSLGSYLEFPVTEDFNILCEAGISMGIACGSYQFSSETSINGLGTQTSRGSDSSSKALPGAYLSFGVNYAIDEDWAIISGLRYQYMKSFEINASDSEASIDFDSAFTLSLGCIYSF